MAKTYDAALDPTASMSPGTIGPSRLAFAITPADSNLARYARSLRVYVPSSTSEATVVVVPVDAADDTETVSLKFGPGTYVEPTAVRRVLSTGTTAGLTIHGYF